MTSDIFHPNAEPLIVVVRSINSHHVEMSNPGQQPCFPERELGATIGEVAGQPGSFECDRAFETKIPGTVHLSGDTLADLFEVL
jgi:hypothetical protein